MHEPIAPQYPLEWLGCFSFRSVLASICRMCSRGHRELLADFLQSMLLVHPDAEAHAEDEFFAWRQRRQNARGGLAQVRLDGASMGKIAFLSSMKSPVGTPVADLLIEGGVPVIFYSGSALPVASRERHPSASRLVVPVMRRGMVRGLKSVIRQLHGE